jgi:hypothetical protein
MEFFRCVDKGARCNPDLKDPFLKQGFSIPLLRGMGGRDGKRLQKLGIGNSDARLLFFGPIAHHSLSSLNKTGII